MAKLDLVLEKLDLLTQRVEALEAALVPEELPEIELREDVTAEQAAEEIIEYLERVGPRRPSQLERELGIEIRTVLDGLDILQAKGWVADAQELDDDDQV